MNPVRSLPVIVTAFLANGWNAEAARLSLRFSGGGNEVTLAHSETSVIEVVFTMMTTDTTKSGTRCTGINLRCNVETLPGSQQPD